MKPSGARHIQIDSAATTTLSRRRLKAFVVGWLLLGSVGAHGSNSTDPAVLASNAFGLDLFKGLQLDQNQNAFFSPYSISTAFSMLAEGANGETRQEILRAFHFDDSKGLNASSFETLQSSLNEVQKSGDVALRMVNGLWIGKNFTIKPPFLTVVKESFFGQVSSADFINKPEVERGQINQWVLDATGGKIKDLFPGGSISSLTRLILADAIYFKGSWEIPFNRSETRSEDFHLENGTIETVPTMHTHGSLEYAETAEFQYVELPYKGSSLSLAILLPKGKVTLQTLVATLDFARINTLHEEGRRRPLQVSLPRFQLDCSLDLKERLQALGIKKAFSGTEADFSAITDQPSLNVSGAFHRAFVDVNEEGTEAAAATGVSMGTMAMMRMIEFRADHPFIFWIRDNGTGVILFIGQTALIPAHGA